ncbi:MAG TPA: DSD1 family PLP-dependent enzyme [Casimicrobiaceae bacterium]|nr:DSD1 family PLP-dependent enzyme [Casimicrobiaceae bacterium]
MNTRTPSSHSLVGQSKFALDTPALLVDLDVMEANIARIVAVCRAYGVAWRPHSKAHKTPEIAKMQIAAGAIGVTCAKLGEAEVMAAAGIRNILIANQIVGQIKIGRLVQLADRADPIVCVDSIENLIELDAAFRNAGKRVSVAIEVNVGMNRAGVEPGPPVVAIADEIARRPGLRFVGVAGWESHATTIADPAEKERTVRAAVSALTASARACTAAGYSVEIVSCGGTGTFPYCAQQPGVTEVQVGGAIFSDMHYLTHYHVDFAPALTVLTTVTSRPTPTRIVVDAGKKTMSGDAAMPSPRGMPPVSAMKLSAEHTKIELERPSTAPKIGDKIEFIVGYSDTTVHLHEEIIGVRGERIELIWRVEGRGKLK